MYDFQAIEQKWQKKWKDDSTFSFNIKSDKPKYYVLEMLPYPSGKMHMGHVRNYTLGDVVARYKRMKGFNVMHPMGFDAFGLPAENAAIEHQTHPSKWTYENIKSMNESFTQMGFMYDYRDQVITCSPEYYKHEQEIFISFLEKGLAYKKESFVNWDPVDNTVLANEQVVNGRGWRSGAIVERKELSQWFLRITDYADQLLEWLDKLPRWPDSVKEIQRKWIGKSEGALIDFAIDGRDYAVEVFTTRPDTIYGASFLAIAAAHPLAQDLAKRDEKLAQFIQEVNQTGTAEEEIETAEKRGYDTGLMAIVPISGKKVPIFVANFVLMEYGTGALFGCPAHDARDHEFALLYKLPIKPVVQASQDHDFNKEPYMGAGEMINSDFLDGHPSEPAKKLVIKKLAELNLGRVHTTFRIRDWGVSRQRYWGCPIPVIYCETCGAVPVPRESLPVKLPEDIDLSKPGNPLVNHPTWKHTNCPKCQKDALRETDTFDTFFESSWYFLRYCSPTDAGPFDRKIVDKLLPVDQYIGGIEHAAMHLLYARFFTKALRDCGYLGFDEPFMGLLTQGMVLHATFKDKDGKWLFPEQTPGRDDVSVGRVEKMSKSKKNLVEPSAIVAKCGADTARLFIMSDSPPERDLEWSESGVEGAYKFLKKLFKFTENFITEMSAFSGPGIEIELDKKIARLFAVATENIEIMQFNSVIAKAREISNLLFAQKLTAENFRSVENGLKLLIQLLAPFTPHICEELWSKFSSDGILMLLDNSWPEMKAQYLVEDEVVIAAMLNGKLKDTITVAKDISNDELKAKVMALGKLQLAIGGSEIKKVIIVPGKVVNVVI